MVLAGQIFCDVVSGTLLALEQEVQREKSLKNTPCKLLGLIQPKKSSHNTTSTLSQRKGRAPQPSITSGGGRQPGGGVLHNNNSDMTP